MKVQKRWTDIKGHTRGYMISGKWKTRKEAYELAKAGKLEEVMPCVGETGGFIKSSPAAAARLYDLDEYQDE